MILKEYYDNSRQPTDEIYLGLEFHEKVKYLGERMNYELRIVRESLQSIQSSIRLEASTGQNIALCITELTTVLDTYDCLKINYPVAFLDNATACYIRNQTRIDAIKPFRCESVNNQSLFDTSAKNLETSLINLRLLELKSRYLAREAMNTAYLNSILPSESNQKTPE